MGTELADRTVRCEATGTVGAEAGPSGTDRRILDVAVRTWIDDRGPYVSGYRAENGRNSVSAVPEAPLFDTAYLPSDIECCAAAADLMTDDMPRDGKAGMLRMVRTFDGNIDDICITGEDIRLHHVRHGTLPLSAYGSGMRKAVLLAAFLTKHDNGVILIDDIDSAIHGPACGDVFRCFLDACLEKGVQAFATARSTEALDAMLEAVHRDYRRQDILRIVTLRKDDRTDVTRARVLSGEPAYENRRSFDMELRA